VPPTTPDHVPAHFPAGTTVKFTRALDNFTPADGWAYKIYLNGLTTKFNRAATVFDSGSFLITILPTDTESLPPGPYRYCERLSNPGTKFVLTQVAIDGEGNGIYSFSSWSGPAPYEGLTVTITEFVNEGNNVVAAISAIEIEDGGGTFTVANSTAVAETNPAAAAGPPEVYDIRGDELVINVEPDAATSAAGTFQTFAEKTLAVIEAAIAGNLTPAISSYQIAGRAVVKIPLKDLLQLRGLYLAAVWRQQHPGRLGVPYKVEFTVREENNYPPTWTDVTGLDRW
jgi:hypothetical protein